MLKKALTAGILGLVACTGTLWVLGSAARSAVLAQSDEDIGRLFWRPVNNGLSNLNIRALAIDPVVSTTLYVETQQGAFKSTDAGANWVQTRSNDPYYTWGSEILIASYDHNTLYVADWDQGVLKSEDGGMTWVQKNQGIERYGESGYVDYHYADALAMAPSWPFTLYVGIANVYTSDGGGLYRSTDGGESWTYLGLSEVVHAIAVHPSSPRTVYAGTWHGIYISTDGGLQWAGPVEGLQADVRALAFDPHDPTTMYAGTWDQGLWKSVDGGATWNPINNGLSPIWNYAVYALAVDRQTPYILYAATVGGLLATQNAGASWTDLGFPSRYVTSVAPNIESPGIVYAGAYPEYGPSGVFQGWPFAVYLPMILDPARDIP